MKNKIRKVEIKDLNSLLNLLYQLSPKTKRDKEIDRKEPSNTLKKIITDENYYTCIYQEKGKILGTGTLLRQLNLSHGTRPYGHIENIVVDKKARGKGIGKIIVNHLIEKAEQKNCYKVILNCKKELIPFYKKCRMKKSGEIQMRRDL